MSRPKHDVGPDANAFELLPGVEAGLRARGPHDTESNESQIHEVTPVVVRTDPSSAGPAIADGESSHALPAEEPHKDDGQNFSGISNEVSEMSHALAGVDDHVSRAEGEQAEIEDLSVNIDRMISNNWCPHHVRYWASALSPFAFEKLSYLESAPQRTKSHTLCQKHEQCVAYNVDPNNYRTRHVSNGCDCEHVGVDTRRIASLIEDDKIPLVRVISKGGTVRLQLKSLDVNRVGARVRRHYVAISHVWADGLGNPESNSLPMCQLLMLADVFNNLDQADWYFWFDTLCIPVGAAFVSTRRKAIDVMGAIYYGADFTIVLDAELRTIDPAKVEEMAILQRVICSTWMSRSWTLQEAALPGFCVFVCFQNSICRLIWRGLEIRRPASSRWQVAEWEPVSARRPGGEVASLVRKVEAEYVRHLSTALYDVRRSSGQAREAFVDTWNALLGRSTSQKEDVFFMITNILGIDCSKLFDTPYNQRLEAIIFSLGQIPLSLLLLPIMPQTHTRASCDRWIPEELSNVRLKAAPYATVEPGFLTCHINSTQTKSTQLIFVLLDGHVAQASARSYVNFLHNDINTTWELWLDGPVLTLSSNYTRSCLIINGQSHSHGNPADYAAVFHVEHLADYDETTACPTTIELVYQCSARIRRRDDIGPMTLGSDISEGYFFSAQTLGEKACKIKIKHDGSNINDLGGAQGTGEYRRTDVNATMEVCFFIFGLLIGTAFLVPLLVLYVRRRHRADLKAIVLAFCALVCYVLSLVMLPLLIRQCRRPMKFDARRFRFSRY